MIGELNLNYYRPAYIKDFIRQTTDLINDTNKIGDLCGSIWGYYNPFDAANAPIRNEPLDESIYLWKINPTASAACNACLSIAPESTLNAEVKINQNNAPVPLAMCFYSLTDNDGGLRKDAKIRLAYNETTWDGWNGKYGGWQNSELFYNINPLKYCLLPTISVFDYSTNGVNTTRTLENMAAHIDANPTKRRVCLIRSNLYCGDTTPRTISGMYTPAGTVGGLDVGILSDRPLCDNLAATVGAWIRDGEGHENYDITRVYNPFNQCITQLWYDDVNQYQTDVSRQMDIGYYRSATRQTYTDGRYNVPNSHGKCTAEFCHISYERHDFDDVSYQWRHCVYFGAIGSEIQNGFPIGNYGQNENIKTMSVLEILDSKDAPTYGAACKRAVLHELAYYGFWIAETATKAANDVLGTETTGDGIYLPEKIGGVTTGNYFTGDDIKNVPYAGATDTSPFAYRPEETNSDTGDLSTQLHSDSLAGSAQWYALTPLDMYFISQWLNTTYKPDTSVLSEDFKGVNPSDYIISVKYYPFDVPTGNTSPLSIGGVPVEVNNVGISPHLHDRAYGEGSNSYYDLGSFVLQPPYIYGDFRDEYTKMILYIPWCGFVNLDSKLFMQSPDGTYHSIKCALSIDFATGAALGMIYRDNRLIECVNGTVGVDIPLSAVANGTYQNAIKSTEIALKNAKSQQISSALSMGAALVGGIASAATGNIVGVGASVTAFAGSALKNEQINNTIENLKYQLSHTAPAVGDVSSASPFNGALSEQTAKLLIFRAAMLPDYDAAKYARTTGHACCKQGILSEISRGYTECAGADLSGINATTTEKNMIFESLKGGVII